MYLVREIMYCKPGKVRPLVEMFKSFSRLSERMGMPKMKIMTDFCAEQYWTLVAEMEVPDLQSFEKMLAGPPPGAAADDLKEFGKIMSDYHEFVVRGKREIYKIEE
jgi:hypothetical protein